MVYETQKVRDFIGGADAVDKAASSNIDLFIVKMLVATVLCDFARCRHVGSNVPMETVARFRKFERIWKGASLLVEVAESPARLGFQASIS